MTKIYSLPKKKGINKKVESEKIQDFNPPDILVSKILFYSKALSIKKSINIGYVENLLN